MVRLARRAAGASNPFALAPTSAFVDLAPPFLEDLDRAVAEHLALQDPALAEGLRQAMAVPRAYVQGLIEGGGVAVTLRDAFPDGDWDEAEPVTRVLRQRLGFVAPRFEQAALAWVETVTVAPPAPTAPPERGPALPPAEPNTQVERARGERVRSVEADAPPAAQQLDELLAFATTLGVRIKKVPSNPTPAWLDKLRAKLDEIAAKKGMVSPFGPPDEQEQRGTEETMAFQLPVDPAEAEARRQRVAELVDKAERAGLKLGTIPEHPSPEWLADLDEKLEQAMQRKRAERKAKRERLARQRQERITRLQRHADELGIDFGPIPQFPTEDWLMRAEMRVATSMMPKSDAPDASGEDRAQRLARLLARASEADLTLDVPPDPDEVWLGWAESHVEQALGATDALAVGSDPDEVTRAPTLLFEEGTVQEQRWVIDSEPFTIGRARNNGAQILHDGQLSRQHCAIEATDEGWQVRDLRSTRGTMLNGEPLREARPLAPGDQITIGQTTLVFRYC